MALYLKYILRKALLVSLQMHASQMRYLQLTANTS